MAEFTLPKNSKTMGKSRTHKAPEGTGRLKKTGKWVLTPANNLGSRHSTGCV